MYEQFQAPLVEAQGQYFPEADPQSGGFDEDAVVKSYQHLVVAIRPIDRQLLLYLLDILAVFTSKCDLNKMTPPKLAFLFQPGILNNPMDRLSTMHTRLSQDVVLFLIENQDHFLIDTDETTPADAQRNPDARIESTQVSDDGEAGGNKSTQLRLKTPLDGVDRQEKGSRFLAILRENPP